MRKLGVGIVRATRGVGQAHVKNCKLVPEVAVRAVCDPPEEDATAVGARRKPLEEIAKENKISFWTTDYGEMLERE